MIPQDQKFIDFIVMERMREYYDCWTSKPTTNMEKAEKIEQAYEAAIDTLSEKHREAAENYFDQLTSSIALETEFFITAGFGMDINYANILKIY